MPLDMIAGFFGADAGAQPAYQIARSLRFNDDDTAYLNRTPGSTGNRTVWTASFWIKRGNFTGAGQEIFSAGTGTSNTSDIFFDSSDRLNVLNWVSSSAATNKITNRVFRDPAAWYHIVVASNGSSSLNIYVNGVQETSFNTNTVGASNWFFNNTNIHNIGRYAQATNQYFDGYLADFHWVDGAQLAASDFGQTDATTGQWVPKRVTGVTYGTNGFWLSFYDNTSTTTLGRDDAGGAAGSAAGSNDWTLNNFSVTAGVGNDSLTDTPTNNHCTFLGIDGGTRTLANGNLQWGVSGTNSSRTRGNFGITSGKVYWEITATTITSGGFGTGITASSITSNTFPGGDATDYTYWANDGNKYNNNSGSAYGATLASNDIIGVAYDADNGKLWFSKNGTWQASGDPAAGTNAAFTGISAGTYFPFVGAATSSTSGAAYLNAGQRAFSYTPPTGFASLCTSNLATPAIVKPSTQFDVEAFTGTGATRSKTGLGFQPDLVWFKGRSGATDHALYDSVRGVEKRLESNNADAEVTGDSTGLTAFNSDGYTTGALAQLNTNAATYAAWLWKKGVTPGFDIVTGTKASSNETFAHSLGVTPQLMIVKSRGSGAGNGLVYHRSGNASPQNGGLVLELTSAFATNAGYWNNTSPTSSQFTLGSFTPNNTFVAYLFAGVAGFSRFGSYTGNGSADGPFVHCGFRPRWIMYKRTDTTSDWRIFDASRSPYNLGPNALMVNLSSAEDTGSSNIDILSNGFKMRDAGAFNISGGTYIFAAFAEFPFKFANAR